MNIVEIIIVVIDVFILGACIVILGISCIKKEAKIQRLETENSNLKAKVLDLVYDSSKSAKNI